MKKIIQLSTLIIILTFGSSKVYSQVNYSSGCIASPTKYSSAIGKNTQGLGFNSFAAGEESIANSVNSIALGERCFAGSQSCAIGQNAKAMSDNSFAFGRFVETSSIGAGSIVIGASNTAYGILKNDISNSLMIGFSSTPIFFANSTKIGIATKNPLFTFDVNGTSFFRDEVRLATLRTSKGKRIVITDEEGKLSFTEDFIEIPGDNLGNHIATNNLKLGNFRIYNGSTQETNDKSFYPGLFLDSKNNVIVENGTNAFIQSLAGSKMSSGLWACSWASGGYGLVLDAGNESGGIYCDFNNPQPIMKFISKKVGIGADPISTSKYNLFVGGGIETDEVLVKLQSEWSDYVFAKDYALRSLSEVEDYINKHNKLPDVPSAVEVRENGVNLGEMDAILLKKIEELTLYIIAQQKEIEKLKSEQR